jgi:hypothetical protein
MLLHGKQADHREKTSFLAHGGARCRSALDWRVTPRGYFRTFRRRFAARMLACYAERRRLSAVRSASGASMNLATWIGIGLCITQAAAFSGLNLAVFSRSRLRLEVESAGGNAHARAVLALRKDSNFTLATILWGNTSANVLLTLLSHSVLAGAPPSTRIDFFEARCSALNPQGPSNSCTARLLRPIRARRSAILSDSSMYSRRRLMTTSLITT